MARVRTFIAVELDEPVRDRLVSLQQRFAATGARAKWVEPENMHLTLLFLGEVNQRDVWPLCDVVTKTVARTGGFTLAVEGVGAFPNLRRPNILWAGVGEGREELIALHDKLEEPLLDMGCYRREARTYTPHLTLGRLTADGVTDALLSELPKLANWQGGSIRVREVQVLKSELMRDGPRYTVFGRAKL